MGRTFSARKHFVSGILAILLLCPASSLAATWFHAKEPRAVLLMIHGLNLKPEKMDQLAAFLARSGIEVLRSELSGHHGSAQGDDPVFGEVTADNWAAEAKADCEVARAQAEKLRVPLHFLGFSIGGVLGELLLAEPNSRGFGRVVLLAPALRLRTSVYLLKPLFLLGRGFVLGSRNDPAYRANAGTPMAAYQALFELRSRVEASSYRAANVPTLIVMDREDEVVDFDSVERIVGEHSLSNWNLFSVSNEKSSLEDKRHHLIVDESAVGTDEWLRMRNAILRHLLADATLPPSG